MPNVRSCAKMRATSRTFEQVFAPVTGKVAPGAGFVWDSASHRRKAGEGRIGGWDQEDSRVGICLTLGSGDEERTMKSEGLSAEDWSEEESDEHTGLLQSSGTLTRL